MSMQVDSAVMMSVGANLNQLLIEMDGFAAMKESLSLLLLTVRCIDPALLRAGRFDRKLGRPPDVDAGSGSYSSRSC